jgi:uncharacterized protein
MMHKQQTRLFSVVLSLVIISAAFLLFSGGNSNTAAAQIATPQIDIPRTVTVSGQGIVQIQPDQAFVVLGVQTQADTASEALTQNNTQIEALVNTLRTAGIQARDIQTRTLRLQPQYKEVPPGQQDRLAGEIIGYVAINTVEIQIRQVANVGTILDRAVAAGGNTIESIRFDVSDSSNVVDQARQAAMNDANQKATQLAQLAGAELGNVITINEYSRIPRPAEQFAMEQADAAVPISPGTEAIEIEVQVTWAIE